MIPGRLGRLQVGGLIIELPTDPGVAEPEAVERYLRPFATDRDGPPDICLVHRAVEDQARDSVSPETSVVTRRFIGVAPEWIEIESRYDITPGRDGLRVTGPLSTVIDLVGATHIGLAFALPQRSGLLLHASVAVAHGLAFVFPGPSETGKSTAVRGFAGGRVLCDERCLVRRTGDGWIVAAVPMAKEEYSFGRSESVPLGMLVFVAKGAPLAVTTLSPLAAVSRLTAGVVHRRYDAAGAARMIDVQAALVASVPCVELSYRPGEAFGAELVGRIRPEGAAAVRGQS